MIKEQLKFVDEDSPIKLVGDSSSGEKLTSEPISPLDPKKVVSEFRDASPFK